MPTRKSKEEKDYHNKVAQLTCMARGCNSTEVMVHHKTGAGMALRSSHYDVMPLCHYHHQGGNFGECVHNGTKTFERKYGSQRAMVRLTKYLLGFK